MLQMSQPAQNQCFESWQLLESRSFMSLTHLLSGGAFATGAAVLVQLFQVSMVHGSTGDLPVWQAGSAPRLCTRKV